MKPRLYSAPATEEDLEVWCLVAYRFSFGDHVAWNALAHVTREAAKRDADLMLYAQQNRRYGWVRTDGQREIPILPGQYVRIRGGPCLGAV